MKKIIILLILFLALSFQNFAQQLYTETFTGGTLPAIGSPFNVPIDVTGFEADIYGVLIYFEYDLSILEYIGNENPYNQFVTVNQVGSDRLYIELVDYDNLTQFTIPNNSTIIELKFKYLGGYTDLTYPLSATSSEFSTYMNSSFDEIEITDVVNGAVNGTYFMASIDGGDWNTPADWSTGVVPNAWANVTVVAGTETTIDADASANDLTIENGGKLTLNSGKTLAVGGDFLVKSTPTGNGSFINKDGTLDVTDNTWVQSYVTSGTWHGISPPVQGVISDDLVFDNGVTVWLTWYDELNSHYEYVDYWGYELNPMQGYMTWIEDVVTDHTYTFSGDLNTSLPSMALPRANDGFNYVGNPFSSAIDWEATSGWNRVNLNGAYYVVYNGHSFASYVGGISTPPEASLTQNISMNQGFFVQSQVGGGTLSMTYDVCVHDASLIKEVVEVGKVVRLQLEDAGQMDETVLRFHDAATVDFDGNLDAHKMFSSDANYPQLYSTANEGMAINSLPSDYREAIHMDVRGANGNEMTISLTESADFDNLYLQDEYNGVVVNLMEESYTFTYDASFTDRFTLFFTVTGVNESNLLEGAKIFAADKTIQVMLDGMDQANVSVSNMLGQVVDTRKTSGSVTRIPVQHSGIYLVTLRQGNQVSTQKVFIK